MYYTGFADIATRGKREGNIEIAVFASIKDMEDEDSKLLEDYFSGMSEDDLLEKYPNSKGFGNKPLLNSLNIGKIYSGIDFVSETYPIIYWNFTLNDNFPVYVSDIFKSKKEAYNAFYKSLSSHYNESNLYRLFVKAIFSEEIKGVNSL
jgi:hypothetical protein